MRANEYELVRQVQAQHWWWLGREKVVKTVIEKFLDLSTKLNVADVGCGFGANISMLRQYGDVTGLELNDKAIENVNERWGNSVQTFAWKSPDPVPMRFNFMLLADVLEHIPDHEGAVGWIFNHLEDNGHVLITVPAHQFLWTQMDDVLDHHRRYTMTTLLALFDDRFEIVYASYYNMFLFPVKVMFMLFDRLKTFLFPKVEKRSYNDMPPRFINSIFKNILKSESLIVQRGKIPFGVGLVCLARRKIQVASTATQPNAGIRPTGT